MFSSNSSIFNLRSIDVLEYIDFDDEEINDFNNLNNNNDNTTSLLGGININSQSSNRFSNNLLISKMRIKTLLAFLRVALIMFFYILDNAKLSSFLFGVLALLIIHEVLVIGNYSFVYFSYYINRMFNLPNNNNNNNYQIPKICYYIDILNNFLFFSWFVYGNIMILCDKKGIEESLILVVLLGYFIYSRLIFYVVFFITFCPCITYVLLFDNPRTHNQRRKEKLKNKLKEQTYKEYRDQHNYDLDNCIICANDFQESEMVIQLPCNAKHCYHADCIRKWIEKRTICPLCRINLITSQDNNNNNNINIDNIDINHIASLLDQEQERLNQNNNNIVENNDNSNQNNQNRNYYLDVNN